MKSLLLTVLATIMIFGSCKDEGDCCGENIDTTVDISVVSQDGTDMLNPNTFQENEISIFNLINGEVIEVSNPSANTSNGFVLLSPSNTNSEGYIMRLFPNTSITEDYPVTYIQWNENDTDTLKAELNRGDNYEIATKVWLNDELVWDLLSDGDLRQFEIIK